MIKKARETQIPIAMVLAGGYSSESAQVQTRSIEAIISKFDKRK